MESRHTPAAGVMSAALYARRLCLYHYHFYPRQPYEWRISRTSLGMIDSIKLSMNQTSRLYAVFNGQSARGIRRSSPYHFPLDGHSEKAVVNLEVNGISMGKKTEGK